MTKASIDAHVASLLLILPVLCSSMGFVITQPATGSVVELDGDKGVVISFRYSRAAIPKLTVRVDVMGYPDPNGWPYVSVEGEGGGGSGTLVSGRVRVWGLEPGAVNIRIRCISEDGNNAVAEGTAVYFLSPSEVRRRLRDAQPWLKPFIREKARNLAVESGRESASSSTIGIESTRPENVGSSVEGREDGGGVGREVGDEGAKVEENESVERGGSSAGVLGADEGEKEGNTAVVGLLNGFDTDRLFPFVESLRHGGYEGKLFLIPVNPEVSCDTGLLSCIRVIDYLKHRNATVLDFPSEIDTCRQRQGHHDGFTALQIIAWFAASREGRALSRMVVVDTARVLFQASPFIVDSPRVGQMIQGYADHGEGASPPVLLFRGGSGVERSSEGCMGKRWGWGIEGGGGRGGGGGGENSGRGTIVEVLSGSPQYVLRLAAHAMLEQEHRWFTHGVSCGVGYGVMLSWADRRWSGEMDVVRLNAGSGEAGYGMVLSDRRHMCEEGAAAGVACLESNSKGTVSRQKCVNLGCCWRDGGSYGDDSLAHSPVECFRPANQGHVPYTIRDGRVLRAGFGNSRQVEGGGKEVDEEEKDEDGDEEEEEKDEDEDEKEFTMVLNYRSSHKVTLSFWDRHHQTFLRHFPPKISPTKSGRFRRDSQRVADALLNGTWQHPLSDGSNWAILSNGEGLGQRNLERHQVEECLSGTDVHMFGDSRMRALSFSLMNALSPEVDDTDDNLKDLVVPLEAASVCGGNKRYDPSSHIACASKMGYSLSRRNTTLSFHEMFHFDHGPTLSAVIDSIIDKSRRDGRGAVVIVAIGFHFISQSPFDPGSTMASFLPHFLDTVWRMDEENQAAMWLTMEPTSGGEGAWPELELVNSASQRAVRASGAASVFDAYRLARGREDLLTDGSHYSYHYRRVAARLILDTLCPLSPTQSSHG